MTIQEMKERRKELGYSYKMLSEISKVPVGTIQKIFGGITESPRRDTILALEKALRLPGEEVPAGFSADIEEARRLLAQGIVLENMQGRYTVEDYYLLPDDKRMELIDGVLYDMNAPTTLHQVIQFHLSYELQSFIRKNKGNCLLVPAPFDVWLDRDDYTMLQPDISIICKRDNFTEQRGEGAPDMVVEILSPSTRKKDMTLKLSKYTGAGVREYWIVDPKKERVITYRNLQEEAEVSIYSFEDQIPVGIWDDRCIIDFGKLYGEIREMFAPAE